MRSDAALEFERVWRRLEAADEVRLDELQLAGEHQAAFALAMALREVGRDQGTMNTEAAWERLMWRLDRRPHVRARPARARPHWPVRVIAAAAAIVALAVASLHAEPGSVLYPVRTSLERTALVFLPNDASVRLRIAQARLDDLLHVLSDGPATAAPGIARALVDERAAAKARGAIVRALDARIRSEVTPALAAAPSRVADEVRAILGPLLPREAKTSPPRARPDGVTPRPTSSEGSETPAPGASGEGSDGDPGRHEASGGSDDTSGRSGQGPVGSDEGSGGSDPGSGGKDGPSGDTESGSGGTDPGTGGQDSGGSDQASDGSGPAPGGETSDGGKGTSGSQASDGADGTTGDEVSGGSAQAPDASDQPDAVQPTPSADSD